MGLVQKDDFQMIDTCFKDTVGIKDEIAAAIDLFKLKDPEDVLKGVEDILDVVIEFPNVMSACKDMQKDIDRIEDWYDIMFNPKKLIQTVTHNIFAHPFKIQDDSLKIAYDLGASDYQNMGKNTADILVTILGPVPPYNSTHYYEKHHEHPEHLNITQW